MQDIEELSNYKIESCVVGKAIYEGTISIEDLKQFV